MKKLLSLILTLTLVFAMAACGEDTSAEDAENAADAAKKLSLDVKDPLGVTADITLPTEGLHGSKITWSSNNPDVIAADGTVTRPAIGSDPVTVILKAVVKVGDETTEKEFTLKVLAAVPSIAVTIADFNNVVAEGDVVEITGVVTGTIVGKGFHISDGTGHTYVFEGNDASANIGDEVTVMGEKKIYYNIPEIINVQSLVINSSGNALPNFVDTTINAIYSEDNENTDIYNTMIKFSGVVEIMGDNNNVYLSWYDANLDKQSVEIYYKSGSADKIAEVKALTGKFVSVEAILMDYFSQGWWRISVNTPGTVTELTLTDAEKANFDAASLDLGSLSQVQADLTLPSTGVLGSQVTWASSDESIITTAGVVTLPSVETVVTLTATTTVGTETATKTFEATVVSSDSQPDTVAMVLAKEANTAVTFTGVISGFDGFKPFIQDTDGTSIFVDSDIAAQVGDEVVISGKVAVYDDNGYAFASNKEVVEATLVEIVSSDNTVVITTATPDVVFDGFPGNAGQRYKFVDVVITNLDDTHGNSEIATTNGILVFETPTWLVDGFFTNNTIPVFEFNVLHVSYGDVVLSAIFFDGLTDEQKAVVYPSNEGAPDLFFSEYIEGSGNNKALELYNPTTETINLSGYSIVEFYGTDEGKFNTYVLEGTLAPGEVLVITITDSDFGNPDPAIVAQADVRLEYPSVAHFNGDDALQLLKGDVVIDQIGDPLTAGGDDFAKDVTLVRNPDILHGNVVYTIGEWTVKATDDFTDLGTHTVTQ